MYIKRSIQSFQQKEETYKTEYQSRGTEKSLARVLYVIIISMQF